GARQARAGRAIGSANAGLAGRARRAGAAAVDVGLGAVAQPVTARRRGAGTAAAQVAAALARHAALASGGTRGAIGTATVDVRLGAVECSVETRGHVRDQVRLRRCASV